MKKCDDCICKIEYFSWESDSRLIVHTLKGNREGIYDYLPDKAEECFIFKFCPKCGSKIESEDEKTT